MRRASNLISALMTLALGVLFVIMKTEVISIAITVIGVALIVVAVLELVKLHIISAIVKAVIGILVLLIGHLVPRIAIFVIGIALLVYGISELFKRLFTKKGGNKFWKKLLSFIQPIFCILASLFLLKNGGEAISWAIIIAGILFIVDGILGVINAVAKN